MRSSFFELNVAMTGLFSSKTQMETIYHNVSNTDTKGYTKQYAMQSASTPLALNNGKGMVGTGSVVYGIGQIRDFYLDTKYWYQSGHLGEYVTKSTQSKIMEATFNEPSTTSFATHLSTLFSNVSEVMKNAGDLETRAVLRELTSSFATYINQTAATLEQQQRDINGEVKLIVDRINTLGRQIQGLNKLIHIAEIDGSNANDLRDQRALAVDELSQYVNLEVAEKSIGGQKQFSVYINGSEFVHHYDMTELTCKARTYKLNPEDADGLYDIYWNTGIKFDMYNSRLTGQLKGLIDVRDGNNDNTFYGTVANSTTETDGRVTLTITNFNRDDMQEMGNIRVGGYTFVYEDLIYESDPAGDGSLPPQIKVTIPPETGKVDIGNARYNFENLKMNTAGTSDRISFDILPPPTVVNGSIKIGDMQIFGDVATTPIFDSTTGEVIGTTITVTDVSRPDLSSLTTATGQSVQIGKAADYRGIPYYQNKLNEFVRTLAQAFNEGERRVIGGVATNIDSVAGHVNGYDLDGQQGNYFFSYDGFVGTYPNDVIEYNKLTAKTFCVDQSLFDDLRNMAASDNENPDISNGKIFEELLSLQYNTTMFNEGEAGSYIQGMIITLGVDTKQASEFESNQVDVVNSVQNQRLSVSGVSIDEEMAHLIFCQQIYNASAKMINTIDQVYDKLINGLGSF